MYIRLNTFSVGTAGVRSSRGWLIVLLPSSGLRKASQSVTVFEADTAQQGSMARLASGTPGRMLRPPMRP